MRKLLTMGVAATALLWAGSAQAGGELFFYNWTDYTSPKLIKKFEKETGIKVTMDTYDSNETLLAKLKSGATGYDLAVPSQNFVQIMVKEGLIQKIDTSALSNYKNMDKRWRNPFWDTKQEYTAPWHLGTTSFAYRADLYSGKGTSLKELFEPSDEVKGKLGIFKTPEEVANLAYIYLGKPLCDESPETFKAVQKLLMAQKPYVKIYSSEGRRERMVDGVTIMATWWSGDTMRGRIQAEKKGSKVKLRYAFPKEGVVGWFDSLVIPTGAKNVENAKIFINWMMKPENAAMSSNFTRYANAIDGSQKFMDAVLKTAPEMSPPAGVPTFFSKSCGPKYTKAMDKIWTRLLQ